MCVCVCVCVMWGGNWSFLSYLNQFKVWRLGFTFLNPGLQARSEYQWGMLSYQPTRPWLSAVLLSRRTDPQLVPEVHLALRNSHAALAAILTKFFWIQRSITVKHDSLMFVINATCFGSRIHHLVSLYKNFKRISTFALWIVSLFLL
jgi:hypothetical protein